ncbi:unnamed protein product [Trichobilharzia szidati]|nr:unnamed protein product [Trichobilharzia szidati]
MLYNSKHQQSPDYFSSECSLFVGELTEDVDDLALFNACRSAKVVMTNGKSRGYGFVRFLTESDMDKALIEMQNYCGLGYKPIRVSLAIPKRYNIDGSLVVTRSVFESTSVVPSEPEVLSSACDGPRHVDDLDEVFNFLESSRWHITDPSLELYLKIRP